MFNNLQLFYSSCVFQSKQLNAAMFHGTVIYQFSKVFVHGYNHAVLSDGSVDDIFVLHAGIDVSHCFNIITLIPQISFDSFSHTYIDEKFQLG